MTRKPLTAPIVPQVSLPTSPDLAQAHPAHDPQGHQHRRQGGAGWHGATFAPQFGQYRGAKCSVAFAMGPGATQTPHPEQYHPPPLA